MRRRDLLKQIAAIPLFGLGLTKIAEAKPQGMDDTPDLLGHCGYCYNGDPSPANPSDPDSFGCIHAIGPSGNTLVGFRLTPTLELMKIEVEYDEPMFDMPKDGPYHRYVKFPKEVRITATFKEMDFNMDMVWCGFSCESYVDREALIRRKILEMPWGASISNLNDFNITIGDKLFKLNSISCY